VYESRRYLWMAVGIRQNIEVGGGRGVGDGKEGRGGDRYMWFRVSIW
jgi:hypothetical protein